jgi:hypothetical protein
MENIGVSGMAQVHPIHSPIFHGCVQSPPTWPPFWAAWAARQSRKKTSNFVSGTTAHFHPLNPVFEIISATRSTTLYLSFNDIRKSVLQGNWRFTKQKNFCNPIFILFLNWWSLDFFLVERECEFLLYLVVGGYRRSEENGVFFSLVGRFGLYYWIFVGFGGYIFVYAVTLHWIFVSRKPL